MSDTEEPAPDLYRAAAERLRELAAQSPLPDIQGDLTSLAAFFERVAAHLEAQRSSGAARDASKG